MTRLLVVSASFMALAAPALAQHRRHEPAPVSAANHAALREPSSAGFINAMQIYPYAEGTLYRLYAAPERVTDIALQAGEAISAVAAGDTVRWTVGDTASGSGEGRRVHILVKPFSAGLRTNLIVTTDRRVYHLELESRPAAAMAAISWTYPQDDLIALRHSQEAAAAAAPIAAGLAVESLNFNYAVAGDRPAWRPLRAFDDARNQGSSRALTSRLAQTRPAISLETTLRSP
jgi:type IV secretion system protein VirB9